MFIVVFDVVVVVVVVVMVVLFVLINALIRLFVFILSNGVAILDPIHHLVKALHQWSFGLLVPAVHEIVWLDLTG